MIKYDNQFDKMTKTPIPQLILTLSVPTIISMLVTNIYNLVDTAFVGTLGNSQSGAIGIVFGFMSILQAIAFMFGQGSGSIISRKLGEKENDTASAVASTGFFSAFVLAIIAAAICFVNLDNLVMALGSTETIAPYAKTYISYILVAAPFLTTSFTLNNILRYEGKAMLGMIGMMSGALLNICLDAIFIFQFNMGVDGAGLATAISQLVSFTILISMFISGKTECRIALKNVSLNSTMLPEILSTGFPSLLRQGLTSVTTVLLNSEANVYGDEAVAAMSIVSRICFFAFSLSLGIGQGFQPVSGFNYGAKKYDRLKKAYWFAFFMSEAILILMCSVILIIPADLIKIFRDEALVIEIGTRALILQALGQLCIPYTMVTEMLFQSTGKKLSATLLSGLRNGIFFIPALLILSNLRGLAGIQEAQPVSFVLSLLPTIIMSTLFFKKLDN